MSEELRAGARFGPYELVSLLGTGGMGEVYRARDSRLGREVAIKVLPPGVSGDASRLRRFEIEARAAAQLSHPNVLAVFDVGTHEGLPFTVSELLEGETLRQRLRTGPLPARKAVEYAAQIAQGLAAAHERGIVHRDLKPENLFLARGGPLKILDLGLARLVSAEMEMPQAEGSTTTWPGQVLGTVGYMSPEQARGEPADHRSDIFALGAVLYEMLSGTRAFQAPSPAEVMSAILKENPPSLSPRQTGVPPALDRIVRRCLEKDPADRFQSARDLAFDLETLSGVSSPALEFPAWTRKRGRLGWTAAAVLGLLCVAALVRWASGRRQTESAPVQFSIPAPEGAAFSLVDIPIVSPDGRRIVFAAQGRDGRSMFWIRALDSVTAQPLPGTENGVFAFWSPDGRALGFFAEGKLKRIDLSGGPAQTLCATRGASGGSWNQQGEILFAAGEDPLFKVAATGGEPAPVTTLGEAFQEHRWPSFLPDGRHFLFLARSARQETNAVFVGSLDSPEARPLVTADSPALYAPPGHLLYVREGHLLAQPFDARRMRLTGEAFRVADDVAPVSSAGRAFSVSENRVLVYRTGGILTLGQLAWFARSGRLLSVLGETADYSNPAMSPDGSRVAIGRRDPTTLTRDIWLFDVERGAASRLTFDPADDLDPVFSGDGTRVLFTSDRMGMRDLFTKATSGLGEDEVAFAGQHSKFANDWSADGQWILYDTGSTGTADLWLLPLAGDRKPVPLLVRPFTDIQGDISPDGQWIAFSSNESGRYEVYVQDFPRPTARWQVSTQGGREPQWRRDGQELFYVVDRKIMAADVRPGGRAFRAGVPHVLFEANLDPRTLLRNRYVLSPDGQRFLIVTHTGQTSSAALTVVVNWR